MRGICLKLLLVLLLLSTACFAFKVEISPEQQSILLTESATFNLTIKHSSPNEEIFELYSPDILWDIRPEKVLSIPPHDIFRTRLVIRPLNVNPGVYGVPLIFKQTSTNEKIEKRITIETFSRYAPSKEYLPAIKGEPAFDAEIDPRKPYEFAIELENKNRRDLPVAQIKVRSNVINKDYTTSLGPLEKKNVKFTVKLDPFTLPQEDVLYITIIVPEEERAYQFDLFPTPVSVISYGGIEENVTEEKSFLKTVTNVKIRNNGNGGHYHTYPFYISGLKRLFFSSSEEMSLYRGNYEWDIFLEPKQEAELYIIVNYRPVFWAVIVLFAVVFCYFIFRSPVVIRKSAKVIRTREGGISDVKVVLEVIHRGYRKVVDFEMIDLVPKIAELIPEQSYTIEPVSVTKSENKGTLIKWNVGKIDTKEHRIITYNIRSKLSILGGLKLPVAVAKFKTEYRVRETTSNPVSIRFSSE